MFLGLALAMSILDQVPELTSVNMLIAAVAVVVSLFLFIKLRVVKNIEFDVKELHAVSVITLVAICDTRYLSSTCRS